MLPPPRPLRRTDEELLVFADDDFPARTVVRLSEPWVASEGEARFPLVLDPGERWGLVVDVQPQLNGAAPLPAASFERELDEEERHADESLAAWRHSAPRLHARILDENGGVRIEYERDADIAAAVEESGLDGHEYPEPHMYFGGVGAACRRPDGRVEADGDARREAAVGATA